jgi:hypothetical protein
LQPALVPNAAGPDAGGAEGTPPKWDPALFRIFADVAPNKESVLAFAKRYGDLGTSMPLQPAKKATATAPATVQGTLLTTWQHQIADMRRLTALWDLLQREDVAVLQRYIHWHLDKRGALSVHFDSHPAGDTEQVLGFHRARATIASQEVNPELLVSLVPDEFTLPGWAYIQQEVGSRLAHVAGGLAPEVVWDPRSRRPVVRWWAQTLSAALWLQLADAVSLGRTFSRCRECGRWLEVAPDAARSHRRFCSNSCRSKAYRQRQDRARQLHAEHKGIEEIASELDSDVATVRRWITGFRE